MKKNVLVFVIISCFVCCLILSACGQANSVPEATLEPTVESTPEPIFEPLDYKALAAHLNGDVISPVDEAIALVEEAEANSETSVTASADGDNIDNTDHENDNKDGLTIETVQNALVSGGIFEAGEECVIYRFWSAGIDKELFDLLGTDGTESSVAVYSELLNSFIANYDALQKAVALYEPEAKLVLHVVENSEATDPIIVVEDCIVTYDYATQQGYFIAAEEVDTAEETAAEGISG